MPFAGGAEILFVAKNAAGRSAGFGGRQRGEQGRDRRLRLLAAETAAHAPDRANDLGQLQLQCVGHDGLDFRRVLRGRLDYYRARFAGNGDGGLRFEVKMLLAADMQFAGKPVLGSLKFITGVTAGNVPGWADELLPLDRLLDRQDRRLRFDLDSDKFLRLGDRFTIFAGNRDDRLAAEVNDLRCEQLLVVFNGPDEVFRHVGMREDGDDAGNLPCSRHVHRFDPPVGHPAADEIDD